MQLKNTLLSLILAVLTVTPAFASTEFKFHKTLDKSHIEVNYWRVKSYKTVGDIGSIKAQVVVDGYVDLQAMVEDADATYEIYESDTAICSMDAAEAFIKGRPEFSGWEEIESE
jgi:hypothetical protein